MSKQKLTIGDGIKNQYDSLEVVSRFDVEYPVFHSDNIDDTMIEYGVKAFNNILLMIEENDFALDLFERSKIEIRLLEEWLEQNKVELLEAE